MQAKQVRLFYKPYCGWCRQAIDWLNQRGIVYQKFDVTAEAEAWDEMVRLSGQTYAPVIDVGGKILADFGASELAEWWQGLDSGQGR